MKFTGMACALDSLGETLKIQLKRDNCLCAACWCAYQTLFRNVEKHAGGVTTRQWNTKKALDKYWAKLKKKG